jgi:hypothetical protein
MNDTIMWFVPILGMILTFGTIVMLFWIRANTERTKTQARTEMQNRLIDKFATSSEFVAFVQSPDGQRFLSAPGREMPSERGLGAMKWGTFLATPGVGFVVLSLLFEHGYAIPGVLLLSTGVGLFASGLLTNRVSRPTAAVRETLPQQS